VNAVLLLAATHVNIVREKVIVALFFFFRL
jgi:hypothetical protein